MQQLTIPEISVVSPATPALASTERCIVPARPVRVCFVIDELAAAGTESQLLALIRRLDRRRVLPHLCLLRGDRPMSQVLEPEHCPILRLGVCSLRQPRTLLHAWRFLRFLRRERIDVVQAYFADSSYFSIPAAWLAGVRHRLRTRNNIGHWLTPLHRRLGRLLNVFTTRTIANCEAARRSLLADEQPRPETVLVLQNGVDLERFRDLPPLTARPAPAAPRVGVIANLRPVKGLDVFLRAASRLHARHPRTVFAVAGEGELRSALEQQAASEGLAEHFALPGCVADVPGFLAALDVAVLCSHAEGMSNALLEYMAAGRAIVSTCVGGAPELIADGVHGLLVPPGDAEKLAEAIGLLLADRDLAQRLGEAARQRAWECYSREAMVQRFENFYVSLVFRSPARHGLEKTTTTEGYTWPTS